MVSPFGSLSTSGSSDAALLKRYAEFLDGVKAFAYFPLAVWNGDCSGAELTLSVRFYVNPLVYSVNLNTLDFSGAAGKPFPVPTSPTRERTRSASMPSGCWPKARRSW